MHHTALLPLFSSVLLLGGLAAAVPVAAQDQCLPQIICVDAINPCGIKYGGCYDVCAVSARPIPPPCPSTTTTTTSKPPVPTTSTKVITTSTKKTTTTKKQTHTQTKPTKPTTVITSIKTLPPLTSTSTKPTASKCSTTVSVCWDGINACGQMYGGCFPDCKPWPTFVPPPCPTRATLTEGVTDVYTLAPTMR